MLKTIACTLLVLVTPGLAHAAPAADPAACKEMSKVIRAAAKLIVAQAKLDRSVERKECADAEATGRFECVRAHFSNHELVRVCLEAIKLKARDCGQDARDELAARRADIRRGMAEFKHRLKAATAGCVELGTMDPDAFQEALDPIRDR